MQRSPRPSISKYFIKNTAPHYKGLTYYTYKNQSHYFVSSDVGSSTLFVSFHGAIKPIINESKGTPLPVFRLYDFRTENQPHILCFSDMLLDAYKDDGLCLTWFLDTKKVQQRELIQEIISLYVNKFKISHIVFYASSGGGHVAVDMACRFNQFAIISNIQVLLEKRKQFKDMKKVITMHNDCLLPFEIGELIKNTMGPKKILSYCNSKDYTSEHHRYLELILNKYFINSVDTFYFDGSLIAKEKGIREHVVNFPDGIQPRKVLSRFFNNFYFNF